MTKRTSVEGKQSRVKRVRVKKYRPDGASDVVIHVRDRRAVRQFSIENVVLDEWFPILGPMGFALYALYVRMASRDDERSWMGLSGICEHLGAGRATVVFYNKLLAWCGLLHVESGTTGRTNDYYILDVPQVDATVLEVVRSFAGGVGQNSFRRALLYRLDHWQSIQQVWGRSRSGPVVVVHPASSRGEPPSSRGEPPSSPSELPSSPGELSSSRGELKQSLSNMPDGNNPHGEQSAATAAPAQSSRGESEDGVNGAAAVADEVYFSLLKEFLAGIGIRDPRMIKRVDDAATEHDYAIEELHALWDEVMRRDKVKPLRSTTGMFVTMVKSGQRAIDPRDQEAASRRRSWLKYCKY